MVVNFDVSDEFQIFLKRCQTMNLKAIAYQLTQSRSGPHWGYQRTKKAISHYLAFLFLVNQYPRLSLIPTQDIDQVWHYHILDTEQYAKDCEMLFGCFIHHVPYAGMRGDGDRQRWLSAFAMTQVLFQNHFGIDLTLKQTCEPADCEPLIHAKANAQSPSLVTLGR